MRNTLLTLFTIGVFLLCISTHFIKAVSAEDGSDEIVTHYVSSVSNYSFNVGDCTNPDRPCATIDYALQFTKSGEHINLEGQFHLNNPLQIQVPFITIETDSNRSPAIINCFVDSNPGQIHNLNGIELRAIANLTRLEVVNCRNAIDVNVGNPNDLSRQAWLTDLYLHDNLLGINSFQSAVQIRDCHIYNNTIDFAQNKNGQTGGGIVLSQGTATFTNTEIYNNSAGNQDNSGGGLFSFQSRVIFLDSIVHNNTAPDRGGGLYFFGGEIFIRNSSIYNNVVTNGAKQAGGTGSNNPPTIGGGGGIFLNSGTVNITDSSVYGNVIYNHLGQGQGGNNNIIQFANGGGIFIDSSTIYSKNVSFYNNSVLKGNISGENQNSTDGGQGGQGDQDQVMRIGRSGGGVYISQSSIVMYDTYVTNNYAFGSIDGFSGGGGLYIDRGTNIFYGVQVSYNTITEGGGGGIYSSHGTTIIYGEGPLQPGQPCYNSPNGICYVGKSFIRNNELRGDGKLQTNQNKGDSGDIGGGGFLAEKATMVLYHVDISNNVVSPFGQGGAGKVNLATVVGYNITCENNTVAVANSSLSFSDLHDETARGGGVVLNRSSLQFMNVTFNNNRVVLINASSNEPDSDVVCFESTVVVYTAASYVNSSNTNVYGPPYPPPFGPPGPPYGPNPPYYGPCNPWNPMNPCPNTTNSTNWNNVTAFDSIGVDCDVCTVYYDGILQCDGNGEANYTFPPVDPLKSRVNLKHKAKEDNGVAELKANKLYEILITARDSSGRIDYKGGEDWQVHIWNLDLKQWHPDLTDRVKIADMNNGSYAIYFYLIQNGRYEVNIMQGKHQLEGSPIMMRIVDGIDTSDSSSINGDGASREGRRFNQGWIWLVVLGIVVLVGLILVIGTVVVLNRKEGVRVGGGGGGGGHGGSRRASQNVEYVGREERNRGKYGAIREEEDEDEEAAAAQVRSDRRDVPDVVVVEQGN